MFKAGGFWEHFYIVLSQSAFVVALEALRKSIITKHLIGVVFKKSLILLEV
jgi:hypothetical protein